MATTIRGGMVGYTPHWGFSSIAHMPTLQALPDFEVVAVTAFSDHVQLASHPDVDLARLERARDAGLNLDQNDGGAGLAHKDRSP
jgi:predicted dehydrogenase